MSNPNRPNLSADALFYERAALIGGLASWMTFGEWQQLGSDLFSEPLLILIGMTTDDYRDDMRRLSADRESSR